MSQHLSIRIPWKDNGYTGNICNDPCSNTACLRLKNIAENKDDNKELSLAGTCIKGHESDIPCVVEGACFMSQDSHETTTIHPYHYLDTHKHFKETKIEYPPFSFPARPYGWLILRKSGEKGSTNIIRLNNRYGIGYDENREPILPFDSVWVQDADNQIAIIKTFFENVVENDSLIIPYAKQVPFVEDSRRVVMGLGYVTSIKYPKEHEHTDEGKLRSSLWETMLGHSIRDDRKKGFLMPYKEMMDYSTKHPDFDMSSIVVYADDDYFDEFSYATEHVSYDALISIILQCQKSLRIIQKCIPDKGNWSECLDWLNEQLEKAWRDRGPFPGLSTMLEAVQFKYSEKIAKVVKDKASDTNSYEEVLQDLLKNPSKYLPHKISKEINPLKVRSFLGYPETHKQLFWLLSRMTLSVNQARLLFRQEFRKDLNFSFTENEMLENPYVLYEKSRLELKENIVPLSKIDKAVFPVEFIREEFPLPEPSLVEYENDPRRIRAYLVNALEQCANNGHTLYPMCNLLETLNSLPLEPALELSLDDMLVLGEDLLPEIVPVDINGVEFNSGYQLNRFAEMDKVVRDEINDRINRPRLDVKENWGALLDQTFRYVNYGDDDIKERQRIERISILEELASDNISVLTGGAGTGKTTLLSILCKSQAVQAGGVLLLAPTGKARVRLKQVFEQQGIPSTAKTVAQFLRECGGFDVKTMRYSLLTKPYTVTQRTVIIDESSMLTEEMFSSLLSALKKADRIIFAGDSSQLPPIGAGRPFVDLVELFKPEEFIFPKVAKGIGELTMTMRQYSDDGQVRFDTELAKWFSREAEDLDDGVFANLENGVINEHISFKRWTNANELKDIILETIYEETEMNSVDDITGFNLSLGGCIQGEWMNFAVDEKSLRKIESWQILSAYRNDSLIGTSSINRFIHEKYRFTKKTQLDGCFIRPTSEVLGPESICYGDKVMNNRNQLKENGFIANGEVGIVERLYNDFKTKKDMHRVMFTSQPDRTHSWFSGIGVEGDSDLELAYALTVHKSQGSEFDTTILVLDNSERMMSRELLYTAMTRQKNRMIILYNDSIIGLKEYSNIEYSSIANRYTSLFEPPCMIEHNNRYYKDKLIHKTERGELVRSKSEVIVANMLYEAGIDYRYEKELDLGDGIIRIPDFTIEDTNKKREYYWEHCGMLGDPSYKKRWDSKKKLYEGHGIIEGKNLVVSCDGLNGSIDCIEIEKKIEMIKGWLK